VIAVESDLFPDPVGLGGEEPTKGGGRAEAITARYGLCACSRSRNAQKKRRKKKRKGEKKRRMFVRRAAMYYCPSAVAVLPS